TSSTSILWKSPRIASSRIRSVRSVRRGGHDGLGGGSLHRDLHPVRQDRAAPPRPPGRPVVRRAGSLGPPPRGTAGGRRRLGRGRRARGNGRRGGGATPAVPASGRWSRRIVLRGVAARRARGRARALGALPWRPVRTARLPLPALHPRDAG